MAEDMTVHPVACMALMVDGYPTVAQIDEMMASIGDSSPHISDQLWKMRGLLTAEAA